MRHKQGKWVGTFGSRGEILQRFFMDGFDDFYVNRRENEYFRGGR